MNANDYRKKVEELARHGHRMFSIKFIRRRDKVVNGKVVAKAGEERKMVCRLHVTKGVTGAQPDRRSHDESNTVITVFEMAGDKSGFKCVPVDGIVEVSPAPELQEQL